MQISTSVKSRTSVDVEQCASMCREAIPAIVRMASKVIRPWNAGVSVEEFLNSLMRSPSHRVGGLIDDSVVGLIY